MRLSHYGHLNEYSHVLAQKFIGVVKCKKKKSRTVKKGKNYFKG